MGAPTLRSPSSRPVSMAEVAKAAGVSQQTVSRVVNDLPNVRDATRERVRRAMDELGFRPNYSGRALRCGRYNSIGLSLYNVAQYGNLATFKGILSAAREHHYAINVVELGTDAPVSLADVTRRMMGLPVDGLIVSMSIRASDFDEFRPHPRLSTVLLTMYDHPLCTTVDSDQYACSELVMNHLLSRGHRQIRFVSGPVYVVDSIFRERGWRDALEARGIPVVEPLRGDWSAHSGYEAGARLASDREMTAVYAANDQMAVGVIEALRNAGRRVPEDVSVVGVDDSLAETLPFSSLTTVRFDLFERGRRAFEQALLGSAPGHRPERIRIAPTLVERDSVRDARL